jgi:predicted lipoprotein with Yx(FWY)xxD motif
MAIRRTIATLLISVTFVAACTSAAGATAAPSAAPLASSAPVASATPTIAASAPAASASNVIIKTATSASLGAYLTDANGMTLYTHTGDSATSSTCVGTCAGAWPPITVPTGGQATAGAGLTGTLATLTRPDGSSQVTYNGLPLYSWKGDAKTGDTTGEGVNSFLVATVGGPKAVPSVSTNPGY